MGQGHRWSVLMLASVMVGRSEILAPVLHQSELFGILLEDFAEQAAIGWAWEAIPAFPATDGFCLASHFLGKIGLRPTPEFTFIM